MNSPEPNIADCAKGRADVAESAGRLILGLVPDDFDPAHDVAAGPWCFTRRPEEFDTWSRLPFPPELRDIAPAGDSAAYFSECRAYANTLLPTMANELNRINGTSHGGEFWRQLVCYWLITFVQVLYVARHTASALMGRHGEAPLTVELVPRDALPTFRDTERFIESVFHDLGIFIWAISRFIEASPPEHWILHYAEAAPVRSGDAEQSAKEVLRQAARGLRMRISPRCIGVYGLSAWKAMAVSALLALKSPVRPPAQPGRAAAQTSVTNCMLDTEHLKELAWLAMPMSFRRISSLPSLGWRHVPGKLRLVGNLIVVSDVLKKAVALAREQGEFVVGSQHGASYGDFALPATALTEYELDGFVTWGWMVHPAYACNFIPLPSPHLNRIRHREEGADLVFVGIHVPLFYPRIEGTYGTTEVLGYVRNKVRFFDSLPPPIRDRILYRPQRFSHAMDEVPYLRERFPGLRLLDERPEGKLATCRLAVVDSPSTVLFQALAANVPTVAFWHRSLWQMHGQGEALYDELRRAGIVFEDGAAAARQVSAVWDSVGEWWRQPEVQAARLKWCHEYARTSPAWFGEWMRTLWRLWSVKC